MVLHYVKNTSIYFSISVRFLSSLPVFFTTDMLQRTLLHLFSYILTQGLRKGVNPGAELLGCGVYIFSTCLQITLQKVVTVYAPGSSVGAFLRTYLIFMKVSDPKANI